MALIQFTRNHHDHSTDKGFQFEFFCDRCGNGFMSQFQPSMMGLAGSALRTAGSLFGGFFGNAGSSSYEIERAVQGPAHDNAMQKAVEEAKPNFKQCLKCSHWVCVATCWNPKRQLCYDCAPNLETEMAAAQAQATVDQMRQKVQEQDYTKDLNVTAEAAALCPSCGARAQGAKFCPECGKPIRAKSECGRCGTHVDAGVKFCPECGNKMV
jgi:hypothetical protein